MIFLASISMKAVCQDDEKASDSQLAYQYFQSKEYDKAAMLYEKLFKDSQSHTYYLYAIKSYIALKDFDKAEKSLKKQLKKDQVDLTLYVELANIYALNNQADKQNKTLQELFKKVPTEPSEISRVVNSFVEKKDFKSAEGFLKAAKKKNPNISLNIQMATLYMNQGDYQEMSNQLLDLIAEDPRELTEVQNALLTVVEPGKSEQAQEIVRKAIIRRIQFIDSQAVFTELLQWFYLKLLDFDKALIQAISLDKRFKENGARLLIFAKNALENKAYDPSIGAYKAIIAKGAENENYYDARSGLLTVYYNKLEDGQTATPAEMKDLENEYHKMIEEYGVSGQTANMIKDYSHLLAYYLGKPDEAYTLLSKTIETPGISLPMIADLKLELADIQLIRGNQWDAILIYAQVDEDNKQAPIGSEAKFRRARAAYFTGDFKWAQSQLDILKASTSKLIANDAMDLSLFITDNLQDDSLELPLKTFAKAELLALQHKDSAALASLDTLLIKFPQNSLADDALFKKAKIYESEKNYKQAEELYLKVATVYHQDILADDAYFFLALMNENQLANKEKAMEYFKKIIENYPSSIRVSDARRHYRKLRGDL